MSSCKVMQAQAKYIKATWVYSHGGVGGGHVKLVGAKKRLADDKQLNTPVSSAVVKAPKMNKKSKDKAMDDYNSQDYSEHFHFKKFDIGVEYSL